MKVVLSTTETLQRNLGMINNRVFEALSCGAAVVVRIVASTLQPLLRWSELARTTRPVANPNVARYVLSEKKVLLSGITSDAFS